MRAAGNHIIQSSGATMTKNLQRRLWDLQPAGVGNWRMQPMNSHDEILCNVSPEYVEDTKIVVTSFLDEHRKKIPLIGMIWKTHLKSWAEK